MNERAITIVSPVNGTAVLLEQVPDAVFADKIFELLNYEDFPNEPKEFIDEINSRGRIANEIYKLSRHREQMFASGFKAGMYICKFTKMT